MRVGNWPKLPEKWGSTLFTLSSEYYFIIYPVPQMPFLGHVPALCSSAVLSPSSSIKLPHVLLWSAVRSLSHHYTISLPTSCWNRTRREPLISPFSCSLVSWIPCSNRSFIVQREHAHICKTLATDPQTPPLRSICIHCPKKNHEMGHINLLKPATYVSDSWYEKITIVLILLGKRTGSFLLNTWKDENQAV